MSIQTEYSLIAGSLEFGTLLLVNGHPSKAVDARRELDGRLHVPGTQIEHGDLPVAGTADVSDVSSGADQNLRRILWDFQGTPKLQRFQINDKHAVRTLADGKQPGPVGSRLRGIHRIRQLDPTGDFVGGCVDDGDSWRILIVSEGTGAVGRNGNALDPSCHGNRGNETAFRQIDHADAAGPHVRSVAAPAIRRKNEHMRFRLARGDFREDFAGGRIDHIHGIRQFGGDVEQSVRAKFSAMRAQRFAEDDGGGELTLPQINDVNRAAVRSRPADPGVSVDGNVSEAAISGDDDFMAVHSYNDSCQFAAGLRIDHEQGVL